MNEINKLYGYKGANPFSDINSRDFSDEAIQEEFCANAQFWSLFNSQHEILLGARGSGKTFLLKMMRRSMLLKIPYSKAAAIIEKKKYFSFYIALQMERMSILQNINRTDEEKEVLFRFVFNSCLALAIISEAEKYCAEIKSSTISRAAEKNVDLTNHLYRTWFNTNTNESVIDLDDLAMYINRIYYSFDFNNGAIESIPVLLKSDLCSPLISVESFLSRFFEADSPIWIVAIDEAEFVPVLFQRIINSFMRSNSMHIVFKVATLPYYWETLETLNNDIEVSNGNDFNYRILEMNCDKEDFKNLTNKLCCNRLQRIELPSKEVINSESLESLLGTVGSDRRVDYFRKETDANTEDIKKGILIGLSDERKMGSAKEKDISQTIIKKYAPIYYVREVYKKKRGKYIPGWFAGSEVIRKVSQGNPRLFLNLMSQFFDYATSHQKFGLKDQNKIITKFAHGICETTRSIEKNGEEIYEKTKKIADLLHEKTHGMYLREVGCAFKLTDYSPKEDEWIKRAVAFSRLSVDSTALTSGINENTKYALSNAYAVEYWLTMRNDYPIKISINKQSLNKNDRESKSKATQLTLFEGDNNNVQLYSV